MSGDTFDLRTVTWVTDKKTLVYLREAIRSAETVVFDLETTGLDEHATTRGQTNNGIAARVVLASYTLPQPGDRSAPTTYLLPLSHPESPWLGQWRKAFTIISKAMVGTNVVGHNVKFDCRWVYATTGVDLSGSIAWDTAISSHLLDETASAKLKERAPDTFGVPRWDDVELTYAGAAEEEPLFKLGEYAARDTYWTWRLFENHWDRMSDEDDYPEDVEEARLGSLARWCAMPTTATLTEIEQRGIRLDIDFVQQTIREETNRAAETFEALSTRYEVDAEGEPLDPESASFAPTSKWFQRWADAAVQAGDLRIGALTPTGKPQWAKGVLTRQARKGSEVAQQLLDYRGAVKRLEYLRSWLARTSRAGRIHATYNAGSVRTGRLSSSGPNMQQVTKALKPAFIPADGYCFVELDYSQIELRVAAFVSRCEPMIAAFKRGDDLHKILASRISGKPIEDVTPKERQAGKSANFGLLYGMGPTGFREYAETVYGVEFTETEAATVHQAFFDTWDGIRQWHQRTIARVQREGRVASPIGRVRRLEREIWDGNERVSSGAERAAINSPVQGFASDIMQMAAAVIAGNIPGFDAVPEAHLVGTVHDSIIVEVPLDRWEDVARECKAKMETTVPLILERMGCEFDVPLVADGTAGSRWGLDDLGEI